MNVNNWPLGFTMNPATENVPFSDNKRCTKPPPDPKFVLKRDMGLVHCFNIPDDQGANECKSLYVGTEEGELYIWDLTTFNPCLKQKLGASIQAIHCYDSHLITQEKEGLIKIFKLEDGKFNQVCETITVNGSFCKSIMIQHLLFTASEFVEVISIKDREKERKLIVEGDIKLGMIMGLTVVSNSSFHIMVLYETGDGLLWDTVNETMVDRIAFKPQPLSVTYNQKKKMGAVVGASNTIQIFVIDHLTAGGCRIKYEIEVPTKGNLTVVKSRPDGALFVVGGSDGKLRCFSWKTLKLLVVLTEHNHPITDIRFLTRRVAACCDRPLVASSSDGLISFWDVY